ncbi:hypothetical protein C8R44DRAFT_738287 [Mycena epipterygia]|nr:hypothetical protein C8R44DRAFT_738287 [Mycena epipterygia]
MQCNLVADENFKSWFPSSSLCDVNWGYNILWPRKRDGYVKYTGKTSGIIFDLCRPATQYNKGSKPIVPNLCRNWVNKLRELQGVTKLRELQGVFEACYNEQITFKCLNWPQRSTLIPDIFKTVEHLRKKFTRQFDSSRPFSVVKVRFSLGLGPFSANTELEPPEVWAVLQTPNLNTGFSCMPVEKYILVAEVSSSKSSKPKPCSVSSAIREERRGEGRRESATFPAGLTPWVRIEASGREADALVDEGAKTGCSALIIDIVVELDLGGITE